MIERRIPYEYAITGWFRFVIPKKLEDWHTGYRVEVNQPSTDTILGDRLFSYVINRKEESM